MIEQLPPQVPEAFFGGLRSLFHFGLSEVFRLEDYAGIPPPRQNSSREHLGVRVRTALTEGGAPFASQGSARLAARSGRCGA